MMYEVIEKEIVEIKNLIYKINGVQFMLDSKISVTKCSDYLYDKIVTHINIGKQISMLINYRDVFVKLEMSKK